MMPPPLGLGATMPAPGRGPLGTTLPFIDASLRMAPAEHTSMQARQPIFSLRLWAQRLSW